MSTRTRRRKQIEAPRQPTAPAEQACTSTASLLAATTMASDLGDAQSIQPTEAEPRSVVPALPTDDEVVVGLLLIDPDGGVWAEVGPCLRAEQFESAECRRVFEAIAAQVAEGKAYDVFAVGERLAREGVPEAASVLDRLVEVGRALLASNQERPT